MTDLDFDTIGIIRPINDLQSRIEAVGDGELPTEWTPEHVSMRLIEAFEILSRSGGRVGPGRFGNAWPEMLIEFADRTDAQARALAEKEWQQSRGSIPTSDEISRMNEALTWPMAYLDGQRLQADALMLWAYASATDRDMSEMLASRKKRATVLADEMMRRINGPVLKHDCRAIAHQWRAELRRQIAIDVASWANDFLCEIPAADTKATNVVRLQARQQMQERCADLNCLPIRIKPHEAIPGRVLNRRTLDRQRKFATATVASRLRRAGIAVR